MPPTPHSSKTNSLASSSTNSSVSSNRSSSIESEIRTLHDSGSLLIPIDLVGLVIGKNGNVLKKIITDTNCKVQIDDKSGLCEFTGSKEGKRRAREKIEDIVSDSRKKFPKHFINIPVELVGLVIGANGMHLKEIYKVLFRFMLLLMFYSNLILIFKIN